MLMRASASQVLSFIFFQHAGFVRLVFIGGCRRRVLLRMSSTLTKTGGAAVFIQHNRHLHAALAEILQQITQGF